MRQAFHIVFYLAAVLLMLAALLSPQLLSLIPVPLMVLGLLGIFLGSILGFVTPSVLRFSLFSCIAQLGYFFLDYGTAVFTGKSIFFASIQTINFAITGLLFALASAKALVRHSDLGAKRIIEVSMKIAADICIYTNDTIFIEEL